MGEKATENRDLEWKSHGQVFIAANKQVDEIGIRIIESHGILGDLRIIYLLIRMLDTKYSEYFGNDKEKIQNMLNQVYKNVYNVRYCEHLEIVLDRKKRILNPKTLKGVTRHEQKQLFHLDKILKLMCANFTQSRLFPKPETTTQEKQQSKDDGSVM